MLGGWRLAEFPAATLQKTMFGQFAILPRAIERPALITATCVRPENHIRTQ